MFSVNGWGTIVQAPELKQVGENAKVCEIRVVQNERIRNSDGTYREISSFFSAECWDSAAQYMYDNANKGDVITFEAVPREDTWDKKVVKPDGTEGVEKRSKVIFRIKNFQVLERKAKKE